MLSTSWSYLQSKSGRNSFGGARSAMGVPATDGKIVLPLGFKYRKYSQIKDSNDEKRDAQTIEEGG